MSEVNEKTMKNFKIQSRKGLYTPLSMRYYVDIGWSVIATEIIEKNAIICEYSGNVIHKKLFSVKFPRYIQLNLQK